MAGGKKDNEGEKLTRIAIVSEDRCKPKKCSQECKKTCPVNRMGRLCIEVTPDSKIAYISETLCIGCGMCVKKCPFGAITIINLPTNLERETIHRYSANSFKLHRLPTPRPGQVLGLVGTNGIGKSTALRILSAKEKPNLGKFDRTPDWAAVVQHFRGSELQNYFTRMLEENLKAVMKPQFVESIQKSVSGCVGDLLKKLDERGVRDSLIRDLDLSKLLDRDVAQLSGGELQRFAIAVACMRKGDVYMFDEPSSYLDVKQRLAAARAIRGLLSDRHDAFVIVVEHDLAVLDYLSDFVCILYGVPSVYGVVTLPYGVREGINVFLDGLIPTENLRFRDEALTFRMVEQADQRPEVDIFRRYAYPTMSKTFAAINTKPGEEKAAAFKLDVDGGSFTDSEIVVLLGENGTGKTTLIRMLAGIDQPDDEDADIPQLRVSYKPQKLVARSESTVRHLFLERIRDMWLHPQFQTDVVKPLKLEPILDQEVNCLSGGELQRVALTLALGKPADIYLIDEPSAYLDSEQRIIAAKVIKRFILHAKKTAFIVEHDFIMATYLADRVIVMGGEPGVHAKASAPQTMVSGMNQFLKSLGITFRRDPTNMRPRINKGDSVKDREQKESGDYFFVES